LVRLLSENYNPSFRYTSPEDSQVKEAQPSASRLISDSSLLTVKNGLKRSHIILNNLLHREFFLLPVSTRLKSWIWHINGLLILRGI